MMLNTYSRYNFLDPYTSRSYMHQTVLVSFSMKTLFLHVYFRRSIASFLRSTSLAAHDCG
jgi:hypothetical protein